MIQSCSPQYLKALQPFNSRLGFMAGITNGFKIRIIIGTPMSLSLDMVHGLSCFRTTVTQTVLTQVIVTFKNAGSLNILATIAALMPALALLMLLPAFITMLLAVA
jgi:hypothetical protein